MAPALFAQYYDGYTMMDGGGWVWGLFMMLLWTGIIALVVVLIVRGVHWHDATGSGSSGDALGIAKQRYAKGEITKEEFEQLKKDLTSK